MNTKKQLIAFYTLLRREVVRMFRIASQVFLPPVIITALYFIIFGRLIGPRIGVISGVDYAMFIAPGLIMITVITNAYSNVCSSLFSVRFQKSIEEMLVSPMHPSLILLGYVLGGVLRGIIVASMVYLVSCFFLSINLAQLPMTLVVVILVSALFSLAGFANGMMARTFDDVAIVPTFILTPLTYLGGVFYSVHMLPPFWQKICYLNPIFYMVNALRHVMTGQNEVSMTLSVFIILFTIIIFTVFNLFLLAKGTGLRD